MSSTPPPRANRVLIFATIALLLVLPLGMMQVIQQHHRLTASVPVSATVLSSKLIAQDNYRESGPPEKSYEPAITYRYTVDGVAHTSSNVFPLLADFNSWSWASHLLSRYPAGATVVVYVLPSDADSSFLIRQPSYIPYLIALVPMFLPAIFIGDWLSGYSRRLRLAANSDSQQAAHVDWPAVAFRKAIFTAAVWLLYTAILLIDYLQLRGGSMDVFTIIAIIIAVGASAFILFFSWPRSKTADLPH